ncbi:MAG: AAA family ATPase [Candidatus Tritonobacter lacicola]|nr:AAA family ATPase [Candidatus Tritonobacter lacicola]
MMLKQTEVIDGKDAIVEFNRAFYALKREIGRVIVGQVEVVEQVLICFFARGHVLLEGVPGLGKTLLVKSLSSALGFDFKRIQFTPDLMPADIIGTQLVMEGEGGVKRFEFSPGPLFTNIILADEINRATPRTQSALLEAMEERQVSTGGVTRPLDEPFFVLATQNPIEMEGTYPLPEAQVDRFMFKIFMDYPDSDELHEILRRTTGDDECGIGRIFEPERAGPVLRKLQGLVREVLISRSVEEYIVGLVTATRPGGKQAPNDGAAGVDRYVSYGSSPRGGQVLVLASKVVALLNGRASVSYEDVDRVFFPALDHRLVLNFEAEADRVTSRDILREVRESVRKTAAVPATCAT